MRSLSRAVTVWWRWWMLPLHTRRMGRFGDHRPSRWMRPSVCRTGAGLPEPGPPAGSGRVRAAAGTRYLGCRVSETKGTARLVAASESCLARSPADLLHLRLRAMLRSREPAGRAVRLTLARPGARVAWPLPLPRPGPPPRAQRRPGSCRREYHTGRNLGSRHASVGSLGGPKSWTSTSSLSLI